MTKQEKLGTALVAICKAGEAIWESGLDPEDIQSITDDLCEVGIKIKRHLSKESQIAFMRWLEKKDQQAKARA